MLNSGRTLTVSRLEVYAVQAYQRSLIEDVSTHPGQFNRRRVGGSCWGGRFATISRDEPSSPRVGGCGSVGADDDLAECALAEGVQGGLRLLEREDLLDGHGCLATGQALADPVEHLAGRVGVYREHGHGL